MQIESSLLKWTSMNENDITKSCTICLSECLGDMKQLFFVGRVAGYLHQWARLVRFNIGTFIRLLQRILSRSTRTNPEEVSSSRSLSWNSLRLQVHSHGFSAKLLQFEKKPTKYQYEFKSNYFIKNKFHFLCVLICLDFLQMTGESVSFQTGTCCSVVFERTRMHFVLVLNQHTALWCILILIAINFIHLQDQAYTVVCSVLIYWHYLKNWGRKNFTVSLYCTCRF